MFCKYFSSLYRVVLQLSEVDTSLCQVVTKTHQQRRLFVHKLCIKYYAFYSRSLFPNKSCECFQEHFTNSSKITIFITNIFTCFTAGFMKCNFQIIKYTYHVNVKHQCSYQCLTTSNLNNWLKRFIQKQPFAVLLQNRRSERFRKIHRKQL